MPSEWMIQLQSCTSEVSVSVQILGHYRSSSTTVHRVPRIYDVRCAYQWTYDPKWPVSGQIRHEAPGEIGNHRNEICARGDDVALRNAVSHVAYVKANQSMLHG